MTLEQMMAMMKEMRPFSEVEAIATRLDHYKKLAGDHSFASLQPNYDGSQQWAIDKPEARTGHVNVRISGPIDDWFGTNVRDIIKQLDDTNPKSINVLIESPGGFAHDGIAMYVDLRTRADKGVAVTTEARGLVASAASAIFMAGDQRHMPTATTLMIHNPWTFMFAGGDLKTLKAYMAKLDRHMTSIQNTYRDLYSERGNMDADKAQKFMDEETFFSSTEAVEEGLATSNSSTESDDNDTQPSKASLEQAEAIWKRFRKGDLND